MEPKPIETGNMLDLSRQNTEMQLDQINVNDDINKIEIAADAGEDEDDSGDDLGDVDENYTIPEEKHEYRPDYAIYDNV